MKGIGAGDTAQVLLTKSQHLDGPGHAMMRLLRGVQHERGVVSLQPLRAWVPPGRNSSRMAGSHEADQRCLRASADEQSRASLRGEADQFLEPAKYGEFQVGRRLISPDAVGVERG